MAIIAAGENRLSRHRPGDRLAADAPFSDGGAVWLARLIGESRPLELILTAPLRELPRRYRSVWLIGSFLAGPESWKRWIPAIHKFARFRLHD
jgi:hypothetical protein